jgi:hypothetical protein
LGTCESGCHTESGPEGCLECQKGHGGEKRKHTVASISIVASAEGIVVYFVGGSGVTKQVHALLIWYELNEERNGGMDADRSPRPRLIGEG